MPLKPPLCMAGSLLVEQLFSVLSGVLQLPVNKPSPASSFMRWNNINWAVKPPPYSFIIFWQLMNKRSKETTAGHALVPTTALDVFIIIYAFSLQFFPTEWRNKIKQDTLVGMTLIFLTMLCCFLWVFYFYFILFNS